MSTSKSSTVSLMGLFDPPGEAIRIDRTKTDPNGSAEPMSNVNTENGSSCRSPKLDRPSTGPLNASPVRGSTGQRCSDTDGIDSLHHRNDTERICNVVEDVPPSRPSMNRQVTERRGNLRKGYGANIAEDEQIPLLVNSPKSSTFRSFDAPCPTGSEFSVDEHSNSLHFYNNQNERLEPIKELFDQIPTRQKVEHSVFRTLISSRQDFCEAPTWIGSFMFLLYHVVFCLAMGSAIQRPHATSSMLGLMTKMAALGSVFGAPVYWFSMRDIPALYPTVDLFSAPFLANIAFIVDDVLARDTTLSAAVSDQVFLATFGFLASVAILLTGMLLVAASVFKLANLGAFLPFPVLCGFFAAVGVLTWTLAFKVDTGGVSVGTVLMSNDIDLIGNSLLHHLPALVIATIMKWLGPKHPIYVVGLVFATICLFYLYMSIFGVPLQEMIDAGWFWAPSDLVYKSTSPKVGFTIWAPPAPCGWIHSLCMGHVHWEAVTAGLQTTMALSFLYLIRCSIHGPALKKNVPNLQRKIRLTQTIPGPPKKIEHLSNLTTRKPAHRRVFSEMLDVEHALFIGDAAAGDDNDEHTIEKAKPSSKSLKEILYYYGYSQIVCGIVGGFGVVPCVAASSAMFMVGAGKVAPQFGSVLLLLSFYFTDFRLVSYIPKPAFSSLLVLAFIDMIATWFIKSYFRTKEKMEWIVVPIIVVSAFLVGLLNAVFLGIGLSTFLFVASFFRSGVVKYVANGISIRSTIERPLRTARWLDQHGDLIQVLVLQNYLFFGNSSATFNYVSSMFEQPADGVDPTYLPPLPKVVIVDLTLVTGMDTSAVDIFADILSHCRLHECKLFLSGLSTNLRQVMYLGGIKPESVPLRSGRKLRFFPNLDLAMGKAEDMLLEQESFEFQIEQSCGTASGFKLALRHIDEQHDFSFADDLMALENFTQVVEVGPSELLYESQTVERGLFFIESGIMKIERNSSFSLSRVGDSNEVLDQIRQNQASLSHVHARTGSIGREMARIKAAGVDTMKAHTFRIARVGPGWVLGSIEALSGLVHPGSIVAVTNCRLHHISYSKVQEIEQENPRLVLSLHKLLSSLMAKRQSVTIDQLATLHSIMTASAHKKLLGRSSGARHPQGTNSSFGC